MSTNTNVACCTIPPVISSQKSKGTFVSYAGFDKVYTTGQSTDKAIVCVYDIFGFWNQTQIGADTIAEVLNAKVFMPDFFQPHAPFPPSRHPPKNDDDKKALQDFFGGPAEIGKSTTKLADFGKALRSDGFKQVLVYGFCWGGKVTMKVGATDVFDAIAVVHPAMVDAKDAEAIQVPLALYPSNDEPAEEASPFTPLRPGNLLTPIVAVRESDESAFHQAICHEEFFQDLFKYVPRVGCR